MSVSAAFEKIRREACALCVKGIDRRVYDGTPQHFHHAATGSGGWWEDTCPAPTLEAAFDALAAERDQLARKADNLERALRTADKVFPANLLEQMPEDDRQTFLNCMAQHYGEAAIKQDFDRIGVLEAKRDAMVKERDELRARADTYFACNQRLATALSTAQADLARERERCATICREHAKEEKPVTPYLQGWHEAAQAIEVEIRAGQPAPE